MACVTGAGIVCVLITLLLSAASQWAIGPKALRHAGLQCVTSPRFLKYCVVKRGSDQAALVRCFGRPTLSGKVGDHELADYLLARSDAGWSRPPLPSGGMVMVYEVVDGNDMIVVYYVLQDDKLVWAFLSQT